MNRIASAFVTAPLLTLLLTGCHVNTSKNGKNDNVDIGTPFGSMSVKTNDNVNAGGLGLTAYPGATLVKKDKGGESDAADVNMSFGSFHLGVKAVTYATGDSPDKVLAFYKNDMKRYGEVLQCDGNAAVGQPTRTSDGLTCDYDTHKRSGDGMHFDWSGEGESKTELRAGSRQRQHIVALEPKNGGTRMTLVALDLPSSLSASGGKDTD